MRNILRAINISLTKHSKYLKNRKEKLSISMPTSRNNSKEGLFSFISQEGTLLSMLINLIATSATILPKELSRLSANTGKTFIHSTEDSLTPNSTLVKRKNHLRKVFLTLKKYARRESKARSIKMIFLLSLFPSRIRKNISERSW